MSLTFSGVVGELRALLPQVETDTGQDDAAERAIDTALSTYSRLRPRMRIESMAGVGSVALYAMPDEYQPPFSKILSIEYPYGDNPPTMLDADDYLIYLDVDGEGTTSYKILFDNDLADGETARVKYTALHVLDGDGTTVPESDFSAFLYLSAYHLANFAVGFYGSQTRSTMSANVINYRTKSDEWRAIAEHFYTAFKSSLGMRVGDEVPSGVVLSSLKREGLVWRTR